MGATALLVPAGGASSARNGGGPLEVLDQAQTAQTGGSEAIVTHFDSEAQTFTAGVTGTLDYVDLKIGWSGVPGYLTVQIRATEAGQPTDKVLASAVIDPADVPSNTPDGDHWVSVALSTATTAGEQYAIVLEGTSLPPDCGPCTDIWEWAIDTTATSSDFYPAGRALLNESNVAGWFTGDPDGTASDFEFQTYATPASAATTHIPWRALGLGSGQAIQKAIGRKLAGFPSFSASPGINQPGDHPWWSVTSWRASVISNMKEARALLSLAGSTPVLGAKTVHALKTTRFQYRRVLLLEINTGTSCCPPILSDVSSAAGTVTLTLEPAVDAACFDAASNDSCAQRKHGTAYFKIISVPRAKLSVPQRVAVIDRQHPVAASTQP